MYKEFGSFSGYGWPGGRAQRGDIAPIILHALHAKPMHGYEVISHLEEKSHGMWRPSAGSVYPTLQLLEEQDLVTSDTKDGKKVYTLTESGLKEAEQVEAKFKAHWQERSGHSKQFRELKTVIFESMGILREIAAQDSEEKTTAARKVLEDTRDKLRQLA